MFKLLPQAVLLSLLPALSACMTQSAAPLAADHEGGSNVAKSNAARRDENTAVPRVRRSRPPAPAPIPVRALNVSTECAFKDEIGTHGSLNLRIEDADVKRFTAQVTIPKRGVCNFDLAGFRQTAKLPTPVLSGGDSACRIYVWEQGNAVTVAFSACHAYCTADAYDYLWPILVDRKSGTCA